MIPGTVGARHPRPKPNKKICCTFDFGLEHDRTKFPFLKMGDELRSVSDHRRGFTFFC